MTRLLSGDSDLRHQLTPLAARLTTASQSLHGFFADPASRDVEANAIDGQQREARIWIHDLTARLDKTFVSSFDREDMHRIATGLGAVIDVIGGTVRRAVTFRIAGVRDPAIRLSEILVRSTGHLETAVSLLRQGKQALEHIIELKRLEEEGDQVYYDGLTELFVQGPEVGELLKWKEIYDRLEEALDKTERVAHMLESVTLKP
jgi:uncharacterized protein Yka (UPF0111/DUF47 family)